MKKSTAKVKAKKKAIKKVAKKVEKEIVVKKEREPVPYKLSKDVLNDPRKSLFLQSYFDRDSQTFGNAKQSAIRAGFSEEYANNITVLKPKWLSEFIGQQSFVELAETHLKEVLMIPSVSQAMGAFGPVFKKERTQVLKTYKNGKTRMVYQEIKVPVMVPNISLIKEKSVVSKIVLPAHDPDKYGRKQGNKLTFNFDLQGARLKYSGN